ncbi:putative ABC transport system ATP-binding protein [Bacillus sp. 491mf]|uniref:ABC transporter ATP-binding protein n=1 Tax=Bacillus sp. 491mf TaxID=1761755 RepID=UPI0008ED07C3|nr:ABC transporter ATP-binding protein [Bacillus sp. 491mf]SFD08293.1 putative ABC transport system ATP-binding protein [Bacillus sp. 491mf]
MLFSYILRTYKLIWNLKKSWLFYSILFMLILGILPAATIWVTKELVNTVSLLIMDNEQNYDLAIFLLILQFMLLLAETVIKQIQHYVDEKLHFELNKCLTEKIAQKTIKIPYSYFDNPDFYNHTNRVKSNTGRRILSPINSIFSITQSLITISSLIILLISIHWSLALISTIVFIPTIMIKSHLGKKGFLLSKTLTPIIRETTYIENLIMEKDSSKEVRLFNLYPHFIQRWKKKYEENMKYSLSFIKVKSKAEIFLDGIIAISYCGAAGIIIWLIKKSAVKIGDFVSIGQAVHSTQSALHAISTNFAQLYEDILYIYDYFNYIDSFEEVELDKTEYLPFPAVLKKGIRFENVSFSYPNSDKKILQNLSFSIQPGENIVIVGHNGSGKTTLIKCMIGLYPVTSGNIYFDDIPIHNINLHSLRENTTVIFQDFTRYFFTIDENIYFGDISNKYDKNKIEKAAKQAGIYKYIENLPNKSKTYLGRFLQDGEELSGGQWQKIAIARALFKNSSIMILDEPTSALDPLSEKEIFDKFNQMTKGKTAIMISHKMSAAKLADKIIVLDNGKLVEIGSHENLMENKQTYYKLYTTQANLYEKEKSEVVI